MKCVEVASALVTDHYKAKKPPEHTIVEWLEAFQRCEDFPKQNKKKQVWQFREKTKEGWKMHPLLMTEDAERIGYREKHAGPFEVE